jgi:hypothetical protein
LNPVWSFVLRKLEMRDESKLKTAIYFLLAVGVICFLFWAWPNYSIWQKGMAGRATLQEAEFSRKTRVAEAQAKLDAAKLEAQAEIERAKGQATANQEIAGTLTPEVLQYQYIRVLEEQGAQGDRTIIYIPTDPKTGLPVNLPRPEAGRLTQ